MRTRECLHETFLIAPTFACGAQTGIGHRLRQLRPSQAGSQHAPGTSGIEQTPPKFEGGIVILAVTQHGKDFIQRSFQVHAPERARCRLTGAHRFIGRSQRLESLKCLWAANLNQAVKGC